MSITYEQLVKINETMPKVDIKGKSYAQVNDRVKAFRQLCPNGAIITEILEMSDGVVTMKATIKDEEGNVLGTGLAQEKETSSFINKTSYIENCETSAVGRALGFVGIGVDGSMCSAEELVNAINNQNKDERAFNSKVAKDMEQPIGKKEQMILKNLCEKKGLDVATTFPAGLETLTGAQYLEAVKKLENYKG